jgi:hypothetical protein
VIRRGLLVTLALVGALVLTIVVPALRRARSSPGEVPRLGEVHAVMSAQQAYAGVNGSFYEGQLSCLSEPCRCIPGYTGPAFLDPHLASLESKFGYKRSLHTGRPAGRADIAAAKASPSSVLAFAYVVVPLEVGTTGSHAYCGDDTGILCRTDDGTMPRVENGRCPVPACRPLSDRRP